MKKYSFTKSYKVHPLLILTQVKIQKFLITTPTLWWKLITILTFLPVHTSTWCEELTHWKRPWCWERLRAGGEGDDRGWDGRMASLTQWTWVWANSEMVKDRENAAVHGVTESDTTERLNKDQQFSLFHNSLAFLYNFTMYLCSLKKQRFLPAFET